MEKENSHAADMNSAAAVDQSQHTNGVSNANGTSAASSGSQQQQQQQQQQGDKSQKVRKPRKAGTTAGDAKRALQDDDQLRLTVAQLKDIVAAASEKVVRECCKQMSNLTVKARKELQDTLIKEHAAPHSSTLHQTLSNSSVVQAALSRREGTEQPTTDCVEVAVTAIEAVDGGTSGEGSTTA